MSSFKVAGTNGAELLEAGLASFAAMTGGVQAIAASSSDFSGRTLEEGAAALAELASATSPHEALQIQGDYLRNAHAAFVGQAARLGELYAELARDAYKPFESVVATAG